MPSINIVEKESKGPKEEAGWQNINVYPSPDGLYDAIFFDPFEFHMSAYAWKIKIVLKESGKVGNYQMLQSFQKNKGLNHLWPYSPWSGAKLFLTNWKSESCLFDISNNSFKKIQLSGFPISAVGSQQGSGFVIVTTECSSLLDNNGKTISNLDIKSAAYEYPVFHWHRSSDFFFSIHSPNKKSPPMITFYNGISGDKISYFEIDPRSIVPYDEKSYQKIKRGHFSLATQKSQWTVGYFLDIWSHSEFIQDSDTLFLRTYRPSSAIYKKNGVDTCDVKERWIEIKIIP